MYFNIFYCQWTANKSSKVVIFSVEIMFLNFSRNNFVQVPNYLHIIFAL